MDNGNPDRGLTHIALVVGDLERSQSFYEQFADLRQTHIRDAGATVGRVAWMADTDSSFVVVLIESRVLCDTPLGPFGHLGLACESRAEVDRLAHLAAMQGILRSPPIDGGDPVGYWTYISDPDGNTLELSFGQRLRFERDHHVADQ